MKQIKGDLLKLGRDGEFDVIVHGANCFHTMGAGIAVGVKKMFPAAFAADRKTRYGDKKKLGTISHAKIGDLTVVNAYTQFDHTGDKEVDYDAIAKALKAVKKKFSGKRIGIPAIGCGLAGGDWNRVSKIIKKELAGEDVTYVEFDPTA